MKKILIAVDVQSEFADKDGKYEKILNFLKTTRDYDYIYATRFINYSDSNFVRCLNWMDCMDKVKDLEFFATTYYNKYGYGLADETYLSFPVDATYDIIGFNTGACVLKVALDMFDRGFDIHVLSDYCYSSEGKENHEKGLWTIKNLMGSVLK